MWMPATMRLATNPAIAQPSEVRILPACRSGDVPGRSLDLLEPETASNIDVGLQYTGDRVALSAIWYTIDFQNRIFYIGPQTPAGPNYLIPGGGTYTCVVRPKAARPDRGRMASARCVGLRTAPGDRAAGDRSVVPAGVSLVRPDRRRLPAAHDQTGPRSVKLEPGDPQLGNADSSSQKQLVVLSMPAGGSLLTVYTLGSGEGTLRAAFEPPAARAPVGQRDMAERRATTIAGRARRRARPQRRRLRIVVGDQSTRLPPPGAWPSSGAALTHCREKGLPCPQACGSGSVRSLVGWKGRPTACQTDSNSSPASTGGSVRRLTPTVAAKPRANPGIIS